MKRFVPISLVLLVLNACANINVSSGHLRNTVPRFTTFTTVTPQAMASCIGDHWAKSGHVTLLTTPTDTGFALQTNQKLAADSDKAAMMYIDVSSSREGSSVRFYTNRTDEIADRSMISIIQRCH